MLLVVQKKQGISQNVLSDEENLVIHQKLSHSDTLKHIDVLVNFLYQENNTSAEKMILQNLCHKIC